MLLAGVTTVVAGQLSQRGRSNVLESAVVAAVGHVAVVATAGLFQTGHQTHLGHAPPLYMARSRLIGQQ